MRDCASPFTTVPQDTNAQQPMVYTNVPLVPGPAGFTSPPVAYGTAPGYNTHVPVAQQLYDEFGAFVRYFDRRGMLFMFENIVL